MFQKGLFKNKSRDEIRKVMVDDGYSPIVVYDEPNFVYEPHQHETSNYLVCLEGSMQLTVGDKLCNFHPGDKLFIPKHTLHFGKVGSKGCRYFYAEK